MNNQAWDHLYLYFSEIENIYDRLTSPELSDQVSLIINELNNTEDNGDLHQTELAYSSIELPPECLEAHADLLDNIENCKEKLRPLIKEKELDYVTSALIFHCDETILTKTLNRLFAEIDCSCSKQAHAPMFMFKSKWPTLQMSMLQCRDGGERFFNSLDEISLAPTDYILAVEVYYFCLKQGFVGRYLDSQHTIDKYKAKLADVIAANQSKYIPPMTLDLGSTDKTEPTIGGPNAITA